VTIILVTINPHVYIGGTLPPAQPGVAYSQFLHAYDGVPTYVFSIDSGETELTAAGFALSAAGELSGYTTDAGSVTFTARVTDATGDTDVRAFTFNVVAFPVLVTGDAPDAAIGDTPSFSYAATGGIGAITFAVASGALPSGVVLDSATGVLDYSGATTVGTYTWEIIGTDSLGAVSAPLADGCTIDVPAMALSGTFAAGTNFRAYQSDILITGGGGSYSLHGGTGVSSGSLPTGLSLSIVTVSGSDYLRLSGTCSADASYTFTVSVDSLTSNATSAQTVAVAWSPVALFQSSQRGAYYDVSDISTLFQDSAGTVPVTAAGDPVGKMLDKSGNGYHVKQSNSTAQRPTYRIDGAGNPYLEFGGSHVLYGPAGNNNALRTSSFLTGAACQFSTGSPNQGVLTKSFAGGAAGRWFGVMRNALSQLYAGFDKDGTNLSVNYVSDTLTTTRVILNMADRTSTANTVKMYVNGNSVGAGIGNVNTTDLANVSYYFRIGAYGDSSDHFNIANSEVNYFTGKFYSGVFVFDLVSSTVRGKLEQWMAGKCGISF
jgi:hypothetical protein